MKKVRAICRRLATAATAATAAAAAGRPNWREQLSPEVAQKKEKRRHKMLDYKFWSKNEQTRRTEEFRVLVSQAQVSRASRAHYYYLSPLLCLGLGCNVCDNIYDGGCVIDRVDQTYLNTVFN